ncbi:MAG: ChbG/HpnK family deacetylase [Chloroflexi bacterium]|nr:ChbG/HpnK family deacetylase [Chloroflexota bacterium]MCY4247289.1 ChbG/HpnK family deacetylase [Chloroflexota bacterium]
MPKLIITADDCGLSEANNRYVLDLHERGYLTAASVLTNYPAHQHALEIFRGCKGLDLGVHLNLTDGAPVAQFAADHPRLLGGDRRFRGQFNLYLRALFFDKNAIGWIRKELDMQVRRCCEAGRDPQHITTHQHFHSLPALREIVHELAAVYRVRRVRGHDLRALLTPKALLLRRQRGTSRYSFFMPDYLTAVQRWMKRAPAEFARRIARLDGTIEIVVHPAPAETDADFPADMEYGPAPRYAEAQFLVKAIDHMRKLGIASQPRLD